MRGSSALVILPKLAAPNVVTRPDPPDVKAGGAMPARKLLVTLKASARNSRVCRSVIAKIRPTAVSIWKKDGPGTLSRPIGLSVPGAGFAKAAGLIQQFGPGFAHNGLPKIWSGLCVPAAFKAMSVAVVTVSQGADCAR